jgi:hypothetical protein
MQVITVNTKGVAQVANGLSARVYAEHAARMAALEAAYEAEHAAYAQRIAAAHGALDKLGAARTL